MADFNSLMGLKDDSADIGPSEAAETAGSLTPGETMFLSARSAICDEKWTTIFPEAVDIFAPLEAASTAEARAEARSTIVNRNFGSTSHPLDTNESKKDAEQSSADLSKLLVLLLGTQCAESGAAIYRNLCTVAVKSFLTVARVTRADGSLSPPFILHVHAPTGPRGGLAFRMKSNEAFWGKADTNPSCPWLIGTAQHSSRIGGGPPGVPVTRSVASYTDGNNTLFTAGWNSNGGIPFTFCDRLFVPSSSGGARAIKRGLPEGFEELLDIWSEADVAFDEALSPALTCDDLLAVHDLPEQWPGQIVRITRFMPLPTTTFFPPGIVCLASEGYEGLVAVSKAYAGSYLSGAASFLTHPYFMEWSHAAKSYPEEMAFRWEAVSAYQEWWYPFGNGVFPSPTSDINEFRRTFLLSVMYITLAWRLHCDMLLSVHSTLGPVRSQNKFIKYLQLAATEIFNESTSGGNGGMDTELIGELVRLRPPEAPKDWLASNTILRQFATEQAYPDLFHPLLAKLRIVHVPTTKSKALAFRNMPISTQIDSHTDTVQGSGGITGSPAPKFRQSRRQVTITPLERRSNLRSILEDPASAFDDDAEDEDIDEVLIDHDGHHSQFPPSQHGHGVGSRRRNTPWDNIDAESQRRNKFAREDEDAWPDSPARKYGQLGELSRFGTRSSQQRTSNTGSSLFGGGHQQQSAPRSATRTLRSNDQQQGLEGWDYFPSDSSEPLPSSVLFFSVALCRYIENWRGTFAYVNEQTGRFRLGASVPGGSLFFPPPFTLAMLKSGIFNTDTEKGLKKAVTFVRNQARRLLHYHDRLTSGRGIGEQTTILDAPPFTFRFIPDAILASFWNSDAWDCGSHPCATKIDKGCPVFRVFNLIFAIPSNQDCPSAVLPYKGIAWEDFIAVLHCLQWLIGFTAVGGNSEAPGGQDMRSFLRTFPLYSVLDDLTHTLSNAGQSRQLDGFRASWKSSGEVANKWAYHILSQIDSLLGMVANFYYTPHDCEHFLMSQIDKPSSATELTALVNIEYPETAHSHRGGSNFGQRAFSDEGIPRTLVNAIQWWSKDLYGTISKGGAGQFSPVPTQLLSAAPKAAPGGGKQPATEKTTGKHNDVSKNTREKWGAAAAPIIKWGPAASDSEKKSLNNFWRDSVPTPKPRIGGADQRQDVGGGKGLPCLLYWMEGCSCPKPKKGKGKCSFDHIQSSDPSLTTVNMKQFTDVLASDTVRDKLIYTEKGKELSGSQ